MDMYNPLFVGFDAGSDGSLPSLNVFKKTDNGFEIIKIINGQEAVELYFKLTRKEGEVIASERFL